MPLTPEQIAAIAVSTRVDALACRLGPALEREGVEWILLKGFAIREALYPAGDRFYGDVDILVDPNRETDCYRVLERLDLMPLAGYGGRGGVAEHHEWEIDGVSLDVHITLVGAAAEPATVWGVLSGRTRTIDLRGTPVPVLAPAGLAMHLALHAAQHGSGGKQWLEDLRRGAVAYPAQTWFEARELASQIDARAAFEAGLGLLDTHERPIEPSAVDLPTDVRLRAESAPALAHGFERLSRDTGARAKARRLLRAVFPTRQFMRRWTRLAHQGPIGLAAAYLWRIVWLVLNAPRAMRAYRRAAARDRDAA